MLKLCQLGEGIRESPREPVAREVEIVEVDQLAQLRWQRPSEQIVGQVEVLKSGEVPQGSGDTNRSGLVYVAECVEGSQKVLVEIEPDNVGKPAEVRNRTPEKIVLQLPATEKRWRQL